MASVRASVLRAAQLHSEHPKRFDSLLHLPSLLNYDQSLAPYLARRAVLDIVDAHLGPGSRISFVTSQINFGTTQRGEWHADYPYNQSNMQRIRAPYPGGPDHSHGLTTIWILSPFSSATGSTLVVPESHRQCTNPTSCSHKLHGRAQWEPHPREKYVVGSAGSVLVMDSRLWHAVPAHDFAVGEYRVAVAVRYTPWWMNVESLVPGSEERQRLLAATRRVDPCAKEGNSQPPLPLAVWKALPGNLQPLVWHRVANRPRF